MSDYHYPDCHRTQMPDDSADDPIKSDHCWHKHSDDIMSSSPWDENVCCWCGRRASVYHIHGVKDGEHGKHLGQGVEKMYWWAEAKDGDFRVEGEKRYTLKEATNDMHEFVYKYGNGEVFEVSSKSVHQSFSGEYLGIS